MDYALDWRSLCGHPVPDWFRDAKFGIYTHWGPYTVPAYGGSSDALVGKRGVCNSAWYPRHMYDSGSACGMHHEKVYGGPGKTGYKDLIPQLTAEKFDADEWLEIFADAGAKFVGPTAQLHDGFAMWDSKVNRWNCAAMGPKRDIMGEFAAAARKRDLRDVPRGARRCGHDQQLQGTRKCRRSPGGALTRAGSTLDVAYGLGRGPDHRYPHADAQ